MTLDLTQSCYEGSIQAEVEYTLGTETDAIKKYDSTYFV